MLCFLSLQNTQVESKKMNHIVNSNRPSHHILETLSQDNLIHEAQQIIDTLPPTERANSSGKFYKNYTCWHFHRSSKNKLIHLFFESIERNKKYFSKIYNKSVDVHFCSLFYVEDSSQEICLWHKDGYFHDGQFHLTILGNANVEIQVNEKKELLLMDTGTVWYLNGSEVLHRVKPTQGPRIEICAPLNSRKESLQANYEAISFGETKLLDGTNLNFTNWRREQAEYVMNSVRLKKASNLKIADFAVPPNDDLLKV